MGATPVQENPSTGVQLVDLQNVGEARGSAVVCSPETSPSVSSDEESGSQVSYKSGSSHESMDSLRFSD